MCPGLAIGYKAAMLALKELGKRAIDEELVAVVENDSCAVDAIQVMTGCTFGKGNLIFKDYGKQVYTFFKRAEGKSKVPAIRIVVDWKPQEETPREKLMWEKYSKGERSKEVLQAVHKRKSKKIKHILSADDSELFTVKNIHIKPPKEAHIYKSLSCGICGEKVMEPRARVKDGLFVCIPCFGMEE